MLPNGVLALLLVVSLSLKAEEKPATALAAASQPSARLTVVCGGAVDPGTCRNAQAMIIASLLRLRVAPAGWRWVVVGQSYWHAIATQLHVADSLPAFSGLALRTTWIHESFFSSDGRVDEHLRSYTRLSGAARLDWVLAHELGHILCNTADERRAELAGGRIRFGDRGRKDVCR